ncbi:MAG: hypothetical protein ABL903_14350 [Methylococcales bacterium]
MNINKQALLALFAYLLGGCSCVTPINEVPLPPLTTIEGSVTQVKADGFSLKDASGAIFIKAKLPDNKPLGIAAGDEVKVCGNLQGGVEKIFDGYVLQKATGQQIIVSRPTPHFGFIIQSAFE